MIELPAGRVGPYLRALCAALEAVAPNGDHVPLSEGTAHLRALDPIVSGQMLAPAEVVQHSGMPSYAWLERAHAEQVLARQRGSENEPSDQEIRRVTAMDEALGTRMADRRSLHRHVRAHELLPTTRLVGAVRRLEPMVDVTLCYDRLTPDGRWLRIRADIRYAVAPRSDAVHVSRVGSVRLGLAVKHMLTRHFVTPLMGLHAQLTEALEADVMRLSRATVGPFWFPGVALPDEVSPALGEGLLLHTLNEVVATDVHALRHLDPLCPPPVDELPPVGQAVFRERRFAASDGVLPSVEAWCESQNMRNVVVPIHRPVRTRSL